MASEIRPLSETPPPSNIGGERERPERERPKKDERIFFNDKLNSDEVTELIDELNDAIRVINTKLAFSVDTATNRPVIQVLDRESGSLIRQIPPEEMLRVSRRIHEVLGVLFDERV